MTTLLLVIQVIIVLALIGIILMQKTGADSLSGLSGSGHNLFSSKSTTNILTKATVILAICFVFNSLLIAKMINEEHKKGKISLLDGINQESEPQKLEAPEVYE
jgi:preprotein translocase subunit SecG